MAFRKKLLNRAKKTRLNALEGGKCTASNVSSFVELLSTGVRTTASSVSARNAVIDITYGVDDYACLDDKCLMLDTAAAACDLTGAVAAFIPGNATNVKKPVFLDAINKVVRF
jgi:hypothetical protein